MKKKEFILFLCFLIILGLGNLFLQLQFVNAGSIGISPAKFKIYFEPNLEKTFKFTVGSFNPNQSIQIYVKGDLSQYVNLSRNFLIGRGIVEAYLKLPEKIDIPGTHRIIMGVIESSGNESSGQVVGVGGLASVQAPIDVVVPYPGKYVEAEFKINDINEGELAIFDLEIHNLGTLPVIAKSKIEIYENYEDINKTPKKLLTKNLESKKLKSKEKITITDFLETSKFNAGFYSIFVTIDYGKLISIEDNLKIGQLFIDILDYSYIFEKGKINKFYIETQNLWNSPLSNVYAEVTITINGTVLESFKTPTQNLDSWEIHNFTGFFDASNIDPGKYTANIQVFYENKSTSKLVAIYVKKPKQNPLFIIIICLISGLILIMISVIIYLSIKIKKIKKIKKLGKLKKFKR